MNKRFLLSLFLIWAVLIGSGMIAGRPVMADETGWVVEYFAKDGNGTVEAWGQGTLNSGELVPSGTDLTFTAVPDDGFRLIRWAVNRKLVSGNNTNTLELMDVSAPVVVEVTFGPVYSGPEDYTVTYEANGGTGSLIDPNSPYTPLPLDQVGVLDNVFEKEGYAFAGWNTKADGSGIAYEPGDAFVLASDTVFYATYVEGSPDTGRKDFTAAALVMAALGCALLLWERKKNRSKA